MNKKGFTLVELLAVIAILAILVIIALPNVLEMFNTAKEHSFRTEVKEIYKVAGSQWTQDSMVKTDIRSYSRCKNGCSKGLDLTGRTDLEYYIELNKAGEVVKYCAIDGTFQYYYEGTGLKIEDIKDVSRLAKMTSGKLTINNNECRREDDSLPSGSYLMAGSLESENYLRTNVKKDNIESITFTNSIDGHTLNDANTFDVSLANDGSVLAWVSDNNSNGKKEITIGQDGGVVASRGEYLFYNLTNMTSLNGMEYFDTSNVTNMQSMFENNSNLQSIDLSHFDTSNVTNMNSMFTRCYKIPTLNLVSFDTTKVTDMGQMFFDCNELTNLNISSFNTSNVTTMFAMFDNCYALPNIDLSHFDTTNVTNMRSMFKNCESMTSIDLSGFDTTNVTTMMSMFIHCNNAKTINVSSFDTRNVTDFTNMFRDCYALESLDLSNFSTPKATNMKFMFAHSSKLASLNISNFITTNVTNMEAMFYGIKIPSLDVSHFDTRNVTNMRSMFGNMSNVESITLGSNFKTNKVTNMGGDSAIANVGHTTNEYQFYRFGMFGGCEKLKSLDLSGFDTTNVTNMEAMFYNDKSLETLTLGSNFKTNNVTTMSGMFSGCSKLKVLDISSFTLKDGVDMSDKTVDKYNNGVQGTINLGETFKGCTNLETIYASSGFDNTKIKDNPSLFAGDTKLVGGNGTRYNSSKTGKEYARIDRAGSPGYFTGR